MKKLNTFFVALVSLLLALMLCCPVTALAQEEEEPEKKQVSITFDSMGGSECQTIYGYAGETEITMDMLPTPVKKGYIFDSWHFFNEYGVPFDLQVFPNFDVKLFASYKPNGFTVTFEEGINEIYDLGSGIELYAPHTKGYLQKQVKDGWRCLRTKSSINAPEFLLSYTGELEAGKEYEMSLWLKSEKGFTGGRVDFLYTENPDVRAEVIGYNEAVSLGKMKKGEWQEYRVKFVAAAPYIIVKLPNKTGLYIDEITVQPTGSVGDIPTLKQVNGAGALPIILICVAAIGTAAVFIIKRKGE